MHTNTVPAEVRHTKQSFREKEKIVFPTIPGMGELLHATKENYSEVEARYPDAAFALMTANNLFMGDKEQSSIHLKAYSAILNGESISNVRFRYDREIEDYLKRHMWD